MMINSNYEQQIATAKSANARVVNFDHNVPAVQTISAEKDTFTLSDKALAMMNGHELKEVAPTYIKPVTAQSLLTQNGSTETNNKQLTKNKAISIIALLK